MSTQILDRPPEPDKIPRTVDGLLDLIKRRKGEYIVNCDGMIRHKTITCTYGAKCCPLLVAAYDLGATELDNCYPRTIITGLGFEKAWLELVRDRNLLITNGADYPSSPARSLVESLCL